MITVGTHSHRRIHEATLHPWRVQPSNKLKGQPAQYLYLPAPNCYRGDLGAVTRPDLIVRKAKAGMVEDVGCVRANLEDTFSPDVEVLAQ